MTTSFNDSAGGDHLLTGALSLYQSLHKSLRSAITLLEATHDSENTTRDVSETLKAHRKALQSIIDIEVDLGKRKKNGGSAGPELDLGAARTEILGRVARLRET